MNTVINEVLCSNKRILVIGDIMLDEYIIGDVNRFSQEAPVPILENTKAHYRLGGASNVCINLQSMGFKVDLMGCIGIDEYGKKIITLLKQDNISIDHIFQLEEIVTTVKTRYLSKKNQQILRVDRERYYEYPVPEKIMSDYNAIINQYAVVVFSDYAKGMLSDSLIKAMLKVAKEKGIKTIVDPKSTDLAKYRNCYLLKPNLKEFCDLYHKTVSEEYIQENSEDILSRLSINRILITCGSQGMIYLRKGQAPFYQKANCRNVADVTGAGDVVTAVLAIGFLCGLQEESCIFLANNCAGIAVEKFGTSRLNLTDLKKALGCKSKLLNNPLMLPLLREYYRDKKIVFTNGCFDLLHIGHINLLAKSKQLGDILIVGINSDESVHGLKGDGRPVFGLEKRMLLLSRYTDIDWIIPFEENNPLALIQALRPDVLVKGDDYRKEQVIGHDFVKALGGQVVLIPCLNNISTTDIIQNNGLGECRL